MSQEKPKQVEYSNEFTNPSAEIVSPEIVVVPVDSNPPAIPNATWWTVLPEMVDGALLKIPVPCWSRLADVNPW
jgi:hypothetical protein